ncbi:Na+/H+ antiporter NhaC [Enterovibrio norvegicus]|uniref:Na+:H+ antiporter, NhaC family n=2 Tax=Enterovibrio norvegicus TaxID=188144 RepID=A0A1I5K9I5_9GAMM|nr:Na+/H+ antiporter NhaC [Enterovibrio norvegicus]OEF55899.1 Na+/H+ antiporter NhaC [Enterovibrio norvegicus]SFO81742.1 Na+:H+ antiporter, NhaC family [Enterovibrio norvegicus DSM 15893]
MKTDIPEGARAPHFWEAIISLLSLVLGISISIVMYGLDPQIPMMLGVVVASVIALRCGFSWKDIQGGMVNGIYNALPAMIILMIVGSLIGVWILAGVVPTLIYYGLQILAPEVFLPACVIICAVTSLATGTSWGTTGTIGVALMGVGGGLGFPLPLVAGAVLSGAYFGDKMSPLSDTTNLAPAMAGTDLFTHIKHMSYTTGVSITITLIIETVLGLQYSATGSNIDRINTILTTLDSNFFINPVLFLPLLLVLFVSYKKMPAIPGIALGVIAGAICAAGLQGADYNAIANVAFGGYASATGIEDVDSLLSRGGMDSMMYTISLIIVAMMFGGVMERTNQLRVIADKVLAAAKSTGSLVISTVLTGIGANVILCDQYMAIVMSARSYAEAYRERGLAPENLSRAVEDSATVTANLVPWNSGGAYQAATLGVATLAYLPFNFFCWLSPIVTIIFGVMGWTIWRTEEGKPREASVERDL